MTIGWPPTVRCRTCESGAWASATPANACSASRSRLDRSFSPVILLDFFGSLVLLRTPPTLSMSSSSKTLALSRGGLLDVGVWGAGELSPERPKPNIRRRGFTGGMGGANSCMPFLRLAPGGRAIVSTTEVLEMNVGSPISVFWMDRLRGGMKRSAGGWPIGPALKEEKFGVVLPDIGGVGFPEYVSTGDRPAGEYPATKLGDWITLGDGRDTRLGDDAEFIPRA